MRCYYWRQLKVQHHFLRGVFAALFVLVAAVLQTDLASAGSLEGNCIPVQSETQSWDCAAEMSSVKCRSGTFLDYDPAWKSISGEEEAKQLLVSSYALSGDLHSFLQWLACQGFSILTNSFGHDPNLDQGEIRISVGYTQNGDNPFPVPWYRLLKPYGGNFSITFAHSGRIKKIVHTYSVL